MTREDLEDAAFDLSLFGVAQHTEHLTLNNGIIVRGVKKGLDNFARRGTQLIEQQYCFTSLSACYFTELREKDRKKWQKRKVSFHFREKGIFHNPRPLLVVRK